MQKVSLSFVLLFILLLSGCGQGIKNPLNWDINEFTFKNQDGEDFGMADLKGRCGLLTLFLQVVKQFAHR